MSKRRSSRSEPEAGPSNLNTAKRARLKSPTRVIDAHADIEPLRSLIKECAVAECELEELEKRLIPRLEARRLANQGRIGVRVSSWTCSFVNLSPFALPRKLRPPGLSRGLSCVGLCVIHI